MNLSVEVESIGRETRQAEDELQPASEREPLRCDFFVDLSGSGLDTGSIETYFTHLVNALDSASMASQVTVALPVDVGARGLESYAGVDVDPTVPATVLLERAISRTAWLRRNLVVLLGPLVPASDVIIQLLDALHADPLFGTAQPRFADASDEIFRMPAATDGAFPGPRIARAVLHLLPKRTITPELLAACMVLRWRLLTSTGAIDHEYTDVQGALLQVLCQARRRGFRNVVVNQAVVPTGLTDRAVYPNVCDADRQRLQTAYPDSVLAEAEISALAQRRLEPLLTAAHRVAAERHILVDCRGMPPRHNGSAQCMLGYLDGFRALRLAERVDVLVSAEAAKFHRLAQRYPEIGRFQDQPQGEYSAAVALTQPWTLQTVTDLHRHALVVAFTMLDTIAWDVLYPEGGHGLGVVWRFIARHADGLLYISEFTRERFTTRFPLDLGVAETVTHLSLAQAEHVDPMARTERVTDEILVFGNELDHKNLDSTLRLLVDAFPFNQVVAFGLAKASAPNVVAIPSGQIDQRELHYLIARARVIVYPSLYEGFGLPVMEGLAYGRPVLVNRSPLWAEIAGRSRFPGALIEYDDAASLIEGVGRALAGLPNRVLPSGVELRDDESPAGWRECARRVIDFLTQCTEVANGHRWLAREDALRTAGL